MTVKVVKPIKITEAVLTASTIPEPDASVGEVEWVEDRREIVNVDFGGQAVDTFEYDRAHYIPNRASTGVGEVAEVLFEKIFIPQNQPIVQSLIYKHIKTSAGKSEFNYDRIQSYDLTGHIGASSEFFSFATETFTTAKTVGDIYIFMKDLTNNKVVAVNVSSNPFSSVQLPIPTSTSLTNFTSANFNIVDGKAFCIGRDAATIKELYVRWDLASQAKEEEFYVENNALSTGQAMLFGDKLRIYELRGLYKTDSYYKTTTTYSNPLLIQAPQKFGEYIVTTFTDGVDVYMVQGDAPPALSIIEIYKGSDDTSLGYYQPGERAILTSTHKLYQCVKATNVRPDLGATGDENETWVEVSPTNRWSQFVDTITSYTESLIPYSFDLKPNEKFTAVAFFGCSGIQTIIVRVKNSGGTTIETRTLQMIDSDAELEWGLDPNSPAFIDQEFIDGLPWAAGYYLNITVNPKSGFASKMKLVAFGIDRLIGEAVNESMKKNYIDLSTYANDQFGNTRITKRPVVGLNTYSALVDGVRIDVVDRFLNSLAGEFNIWVADIGEGQKLITYGAYERAPTEIDSNTYRNYIATIRSAI